MSPRPVYLDVCVLCRPFDDQRQARIHLEVDALSLLLLHLSTERYQMLVSPVHIAEIGAIINREEKLFLKLLLDNVEVQVKTNEQGVREIAKNLYRKGLVPLMLPTLLLLNGIMLILSR